MGLTIGRLNLTPYISFAKGWAHHVSSRFDSTGLTSSTLHMPGAVEPQTVGFSFPLIAKTLAETKQLKDKLMELAGNAQKNPLYLQWSEMPDRNGFYLIERADISLSPGELSGRGNFALSLQTIYLGRDSNLSRAYHLTRIARDRDYTLSPSSVHGFPCTASIFRSSGSTFSRTGSEGAVIICKDAENDSLFPFDLAALNKGDCTVYDGVLTNRNAPLSTYIEIFGNDHLFANSIILDNTLIRVWLESGVICLSAFSSGFNEPARFFFHDVTNSINYSGITPKISLEVVTPEEIRFVLTYHHATRPFKARFVLQRGRWDMTCIPLHVWQAPPANFRLVCYPRQASPFRYAEADAVYDAQGQGDGNKSAAMATKNFIVSYDSKTTYHAGLAVTYKPGSDTGYTVSSNKVTAIWAKIGDKPCSIFAVYPPAGQDAPDALGVYLLYETKTLPQLVTR